ncbi:MAG: FixH family protein [Bdellovibrio sp.]|nr:FixH family protein [Bdellovibrio sp.]
MKYFLVLVILSLIQFGCARPNYLDSVKQDQQQTVNSEVYKLASASLGLAIDLAFDKTPNDSDENTFILQFHQPGSSVAVGVDQTIAIILWMPSMGHGSSPVKIQKIADGIYRVTKVYFIMPGDWEIRLQIKDQETSNVIEQINQKISI